MSLLTATAPAAKATENKHWLDAWHVKPSANRDYDFIDGLRGIAILMVIVAHAFYINPNAGFGVKLAGNIIGTGGYGVSLFFMLFRNTFPDVHGSVLVYLFRTMFPLLLTFVFSVAVYRYFSFPILQWGRGRQSRESQKSLAGVAAQTTTYVPPTGTEA